MVPDECECALERQSIGTSLVSLPLLFIDNRKLKMEN